MSTQTEPRLCNAMPEDLSPGPVPFYLPKKWPQVTDYQPFQKRYEAGMEGMRRLFREACQYGLWFGHRIRQEEFYSPWQMLEHLTTPAHHDEWVYWIYVSPAVAVQRLANAVSKYQDDLNVLEVKYPPYRVTRGKSPDQLKALMDHKKAQVAPHVERAERLYLQAQARLQNALAEVKRTIPEQLPQCLVAAGYDPKIPPFLSTQGETHADEEPTRPQP